MKLAIIIILTVLAILPNASSLKLLLVFGPPSRSHFNLGNALGQGLAKLGHDVTLIASYEEKNPPKGFKQIVVQEFHEKVKEQPMHNMFEMENISPFLQLVFINKIGGDLVETIMNNTKVQQLIKSNEHFDAVIVETLFSDGLQVFAHLLDAHLVLFSPVGPNRWVNNLISNPEPPSYVPDILLSFSNHMTFYERMYNLIFGLVSDLALHFYQYPLHNALIQKYFPGSPALSVIHSNVSLVLTNSHESINAAVPHVPNMIDIGGYHVNPPESLPEDLNNFLNSAKHGVIYFSLGSNLRPSDMPRDKKDIILKVLGSRKENVLWKWDEDQLEGKPDNVMISKWFPQQAILAHPNCKLFISHGGLLSLTESVYLGKPVLALPIFGDQKLNAARVRDKGIGIGMTFSQITEEKMENALNDLLGNPKYFENAQQSMRVMHDRPIKPIELADYWIKYVVRHKGAPHLRVAGIHLPFYKYYMLDVFALIFAAVLSVFYIIKISLRRLFFTKKTDKDVKQKKSKKE